jgi:hypothetical protein
MKTKIFNSGSKQGKYSTIRIPQEYVEKYSLSQSCIVEIIDSEVNNGILIKRAN